MMPIFSFRLLNECSHSIELSFKAIQCAMNAQITLVFHSADLRRILHRINAIFSRFSQIYFIVTLPILTLDLMLTQGDLSMRSDPMRNAMLN
jgi:hypothetical protein